MRKRLISQPSSAQGIPPQEGYPLRRDTPLRIGTPPVRGHPQDGPPSGRGPLFQEGTPPPQDGPLSHEGPLSSLRRPSQPPQTSPAALRSPPAAGSLRPCLSLPPPPPPPLRAQGERRGRGQGVVRGGGGAAPPAPSAGRGCCWAS